MTSELNLQQLRRALSEALKAIQRDGDVTGLDVLARNYSALMWHLVQVLAKLERR